MATTMRRRPGQHWLGSGCRESPSGITARSAVGWVCTRLGQQWLGSVPVQVSAELGQCHIRSTPVQVSGMSGHCCSGSAPDWLTGARGSVR